MMYILETISPLWLCKTGTTPDAEWVILAPHAYTGSTKMNAGISGTCSLGMNTHVVAVVAV
jgi:hypothetical protein